MHPRSVVGRTGPAGLLALGTVVAALCLVPGRQIEAQRLPALVPSAISTLVVAGPTIPQDSVPRRRIPRTHWLTGAVLGGTLLGSFGASVGAGLCSDGETSHSAWTCVLAGVEGFLLGATVGVPLGGLIGGAFPIKPRAAPQDTPPERT
jgi:hypothetical protein